VEVVIIFLSFWPKVVSVEMMAFEIAVWPITLRSALLQGSRYGGPSDVHPLCRGRYNCLAKPVALNSVFVPRDSAADSLLRNRETIF
jgi:hypothetical protein